MSTHTCSPSPNIDMPLDESFHISYLWAYPVISHIRRVLSPHLADMSTHTWHICLLHIRTYSVISTHQGIALPTLYMSTRALPRTTSFSPIAIYASLSSSFRGYYIANRSSSKASCASASTAHLASTFHKHQ